MSKPTHILELHTDAQGLEYYDALLERVKKYKIDLAQELVFKFGMTRLDVEENNDGNAMSEEVWQAFKAKWEENLSRYDQEILDDVSNLMDSFKCEICTDKFRDLPEGRYCEDCRDDFKRSDSEE